jgi:iron complex outermembrane recepter protein
MMLSVPRLRAWRPFWLSCTAVALATLLPVRLAAQATKQKFEVAGDVAERSLKTLAVQSGLEVVFSTEVTGGVRTNPVKGEFSPLEAAQRMLAGTNLQATQQAGDGAIVVSRKAPTPPEKNGPRAAQTIPGDRPNQKRSDPGTNGDAAHESAPIELSPFTVNSSTDVGYVANNTLAGSRLNTSLKDTAATISVMTEEFLADIAAFSVSDAMLYAGNLQIDQEETVNGTPTGNLQAESFPTYRLRGMKATVARNYFAWNIPGNTYNIERIDESRGPNSVLFGVGAAGGIINSSTKQAQLARPRHSVSFSYGSHDSKRGTLDVNQPLIKNKLALRANLLWTDQNTSRNYSNTRDHRAHLAAHWQPFSETRVRAEFERGEILDHVTRSWPVIDQVTLWNSRGRPVRAAQAASAPDGIARLAAGTARITLIENDDTFVDMRGTMTSTAAAALQNTMLMDRSMADYSINPAGPGAQRDTRFSNYMATIEQKLPGKTYALLAFNHQDYNFVGHDVQQTDNTLWGDPNQTLPVNATTTRANPYAGRYYVEGTWTRRLRDEQFKTVRATLSNEFTLGKWGRYRWAAMAEEEESTFVRTTGFEAIAGRPFSAVPQNAANRVFRRFYATEGDWGSYRIPAALGHMIVNRTDPVSGRTFSTRWVQGNANIDDDKSRLRTVLVGGQASWFDHRLIGTFGLRRDQMDLTDRGAIQDPATAEFMVDYGNVTKSSEKGSTRTFGLVWHVTSILSATYNRSTNSSLSNNAHRVLPNSEKAEQGEGIGEDIGLTLDLLDGKIFAKAAYYTTKGKRETDFRSVSVLSQQRSDRVLDALTNAGQITAAEAATHRVLANGAYSDRESDGYEFRVVANPTNNWRLQANFSITDAVESNIMPEVLAWAATETAYWRRFNTAQLTSANISIAQEILNLQDDIETQTSADGLGAVGNRRYKANLFTRYDVSWAPVRGLYLGGGYRYQSKMLIGRNTTTGALQYADSLVRTDALIGYRFRLKNRLRANVQLNIDNLLDDTDPVILRRTDAGFVRRFSVAEPRTFRLSTSLQF